MTSNDAKTKLLVAIDFSCEQPRVLLQAQALGRQLGADLVLLYCAAPLEIATVAFEPVYVPLEVMEQFRGDHVAAARRKLEEVATLLGDEFRVDARVKACEPVEGIVRLAKELSCDYIIMGSRGGGVGPFLLGSVAERVTRQAPCPVVVARGDEETVGRYEKVLVGIDFSPASAPLVDLARELTAHDGEIHLVHAWQPPHLDTAHLFGDSGHEGLVSALGDGLREHVGFLDSFVDSATDDSRYQQQVVSGRAATVLLELAESMQADAIFVGAHESHGLEGLLGTVADRVLRRATTTVLLTELACEGRLPN